MNKLVLGGRSPGKMCVVNQSYFFLFDMILVLKNVVLDPLCYLKHIPFILEPALISVKLADKVLLLCEGLLDARSSRLGSD